MTSERELLAAEIEREAGKILDFFRGFIRARSPNPPGDTRAAADFICRFLESERVPFRVIAPMSDMPNVVAFFEGGAGTTSGSQRSHRCLSGGGSHRLEL